MHKVQRAVIMAAGTGSRMRPVTYTTPKPLVTVNGRRMIDTVIEALHQNGIFEIYVVVGYLKEKFREWQKDFPGITLLENPYYDRCNNISSLYVARAYIQDAVILDGDQIIYNPQILAPQFTHSGYCCAWTDEQTDEWLLQTDRRGVVTSCSRTGGKHGWQLYSVSFWTQEDGKKLRRHLETEFFAGNRDIYWDDVAMFCHPEEYTLGIREIQKDDIIEIDDFRELAQRDPRYKNGLEVKEHE